MLTAEPRNVTGYMPQLDTVRFFAVIMVLLQHLMGLQLFSWGHWGVQLFFVLSGFLITGILLKSRNSVESGGISGGRAALEFYIRRVFRIFPLYYFVVIFVGLILDYSQGREFWPWLIGYAMNFKIGIINSETSYFSLFWSLAVEEQFYFVWPWVVLFAPRRAIFPITLLMIACGPIWRGYCLAHIGHGTNFVQLYKFTWGCLDSLGLGALLAQVYECKERHDLTQKSLNWLVVPGLMVFAFLEALAMLEINWSLHIVFADLALGLVFCWFILTAARGFTGLSGKVMNLWILRAGGWITYGIYVYHLLARDILLWASSKLGYSLQRTGLRMFVLGMGLTILASWLSWRFFELPINKLKDRWAGNRELPAQQSQVEVVAA
ncbi:MAG: hypothetical protein QOH96_1175 [Blastocatellia bacterium]|jgi:peptidoglycan/LPS O-acetylase OafA/YrhL|nr:hypothetical protein [Blastocatellia bacterium]